MNVQPAGLDPSPVAGDRWPVCVDGQELERLRRNYEERVPEHEWNNVVAAAADILSQCPRPDTARASTTGLALGKVQSGKTLSYTALIALAIDNGYRMTIVLAGTKNALLEQTYQRLHRDLNASRRTNLVAFRNPGAHDGDVIRSILRTEGHVLIVVLKHAGRLGQVRQVFAAHELCTYPTLIIDDEGDEASLNTLFRRGQQSSVYRAILQLRDALSVHAYVTYTATPQANLLISGIDALSPDFGVLVQPGQGYCGGSTFFGPDRDKYVRVVPLAEAERGNIDGVPEYLRRAIAVFLVGAAVRHLRDPHAWHSMLIHDSNLRTDHERLHASVQNLINLWRETLALPETDPVVTDLMRLFQEAYQDLRTTVMSPPDWIQVREKLQEEIWVLEVWMVNSLPLGRDPVGTPFRVRNNILIGGNMLGRGVTIDGLAVTYITRRAKQETNADTLEQRARWFGYKGSYLDLCRIFLTAQLRDDYTALLRHEDDLWESLRRNQRQGLSIREWPRLLSLDTDLGLKPTRSSVANYRAFRSIGWEVQRQVVEDETVAIMNVEVVREFMRRHRGETRHFGNVEHLVMPDVPTPTVISDLLARLNTTGTDWDRSYINEFLGRLYFNGTLPSLDIVFMSKGQVRRRTKNNGRINPMQGRSPNRSPRDPDYYPGDEHIHGNRVQLQVHILEVEGDDLDQPIQTTALALYIPRDDPRFNLTFVVRDDMP